MSLRRQVSQGSGGRRGNSGGFPISVFTGLSDCPHSYTGQAGKILLVKVTEDGIEFKDESLVDSNKVSVNAGDGTAGYLIDKLEAGTAIEITANETLSDHKAAIAVILGTLSDQAAAGNHNHDGEYATLTSQGKVKANDTDPLLASLVDKLEAGIALALSVNETNPLDHKVKLGVSLGTLSDQAAAGNHVHPYVPIADRGLVLNDGEDSIPQTLWEKIIPRTALQRTLDVYEEGGDYTILDVRLGTLSDQACAGNDSRLSNARTPTSHASTHNAGGSDAMQINAAPATASLRSLGTLSDQAAAGNHTHAIVFSQGGTIYNPQGIVNADNIICWYAPFACTVTNVRGYRVGGTGATINARRNSSSNHLSSALSVSSADTWMDGGAVQNTVYAAGDKLEIMIASVTGSPTQLEVQVDFTRNV